MADLGLVIVLPRIYRVVISGRPFPSHITEFVVTECEICNRCFIILYSNQFCYHFYLHTQTNYDSLITVEDISVFFDILRHSDVKKQMKIKLATVF